MSIQLPCFASTFLQYLRRKPCLHFFVHLAIILFIGDIDLRDPVVQSLYITAEETEARRNRKMSPKLCGRLIGRVRSRTQGPCHVAQCPVHRPPCLCFLYIYLYVQPYFALKSPIKFHFLSDFFPNFPAYKGNDSSFASFWHLRPGSLGVT